MKMKRKKPSIDPQLMSAPLNGRASKYALLGSAFCY